MDQLKQTIIGFIVLGVIIVPLAIAGAGWAMYKSYNPDLLLVNVSAADSLTILIDGEEVAKLPKSSEGDENSYKWVTVGTGEHAFKATDAQGQVLHEGTINVEGGDTYAYQPANAGERCLWAEEATYGNYYGGEEAPHIFEEPFVAVGSRDHWLEQLPDTVEVQAGSGAKRDGLRLLSCSVPVFY